MSLLTKILVIIALFLQLLLHANSQIFSVTSPVAQVQQVAFYTFRISLSNVNIAIPSGSSIFIAFPDNYQTLTVRTYVCQTTAVWTSVTPISCILQNRVLRVTGGFPNPVSQSSIVLEFRLLDIQNPIFSGETKTFDYKFYDSAGNLLALPGMTGKATLVIVPGSLTIQMAVSPKNTNANSVLTINVISPYKIPRAGYLNLRFETFWLSSGTTSRMVIASSVSCEPESNVSPSISCALGSGTLSAYNLVIRNLFDEDYTGNFAFKVNNFLNPPTIAPQGAFDLTSFNSMTERRTIASITGVQLTGVQMSQIEPTSAKIELTSYEISTAAQATIQCYINNKILQTDMIWIQFPSQIQFSNPVIVIANNVFATDVSISLGNMLSFNNLMLVAPGIVQIIVKNIIQPNYVNTFAGFMLKTERGSFGMEYIDNPFDVTTTTGPMTVTMSALNYQVGVVTDYILDLALTHPISSDGSINVEFGILEYSFTVQMVSTMSCESKKRLGCILSYVNSNTLKLSNIFTANTQNVQISIINIANILKLGPIASLVVTSYRVISGNEYAVDKSTQNDISVNLEGRKMFINQFKVTSSSKTTFQICELSLLISNSNPVPSGSYLQITFPPQLSLGSSVTCTSADIQCTLVAFSSPLKVKVVLFQSYESDLLPVITFERVRNPKSTEATSPFGVSIYNANNQLIESSLLAEGGITYAAEEGRELVMRVERNSEQNSLSPVSYSFKIGVPFEVTSGVLSLQIPHELQCISSCVKTPLDSTFYTVLYLGVSTVSNQISVTSQFKNHYSFQKLTIHFKYLTANQFYEYGRGTVDVANTQESVLGLSGRWTNRYLTGMGSFFVENLSYAGAYVGGLLVSVVFPAGFDLAGVISEQLRSKTAREVVLQTTTGQSLITTYAIDNIGYPSLNQAYTIDIIIKTQSGHSISKSSTVQWTISCQLPCKQCSSSDISSCNSCYSDPVFAGDYTLWQPFTKKCVDVCGDTYYANHIDNKCYQCSPICLNCVNFDQCRTCKPNWYLVTDSSTCSQASCPRGYFISGLDCVPCTSSLDCRTCSDAESCDSCAGSYFYHQNNCTLACPSGSTIFNTFTNVCDSCPTNCLTCQKLADQTVTCLTCSVGHYLGQGRCYESCSAVLMVPDVTGFVCVNCAPQCLTCRERDDYCLRCDSVSANKYFHLNDCLTDCPNGYYGESGSTSFYCQKCTQPCEQCRNSSATSCKTCISGYSLNGNICESQCPPTLYSSDAKCVPCVNSCKTCSAANICFTCTPPTSFYASQCIPECTIGYVSIANVCTRCSDNCKTCSRVDYCTSCYVGSYLHLGSCLDRCPNKFFIRETSCAACPYECSECENLSYCSACVTLYSLALDNNSCVNTCESGFIPYQGVCSRCDTGCVRCVQTPSKCTRCEANYYFVPLQLKCVTNCLQPLRYYIANMSCLQTCIEPSFEQYRTQTISSAPSQVISCTACPQYCIQCASLSFCTQCIANALKVNDLCMLQCPFSMPFALNGTCRTCNVVGCFECSGVGCKQCNSPLLLIGDNMCISACSSTQAYNTFTKQCDVVISSNITGAGSSSSLSQSALDLKFVPFPYMILSILALALIMILNFSSKLLVVPLVIVSFGIFTMMCAYTSLIVYLLTKFTQIIATNEKQIVFAAILALGIGLMLILNLITSCKYIIQIQKPNHKWTKLSSSIIILFGSFINLTAYQLFNSKLYNFVSIAHTQTQPFWQSYHTITKVSIASYVCFIVSGIMLTFSSQKSDYSYYSFIQLAILAMVQIALIVLGMLWPVDYTLSETQSFDVNDSFNKLEDISIDQTNEKRSEMSSTTTIHARTQNPTYNHSVKARPDSYSLTKTKSEFLFQHNRSLSSVQILPGQQIVQGIQKGIFRQDYQSAKKKQQQQKELSMLSSASKLIQHLTSEQKASQTKNIEKGAGQKNIQKGASQQQEEIYNKDSLKEKEINIFDIEDGEENEVVDFINIAVEISQRMEENTQNPSSRNASHSSPIKPNDPVMEENTQNPSSRNASHSSPIKPNESAMIQKPQSPSKSRKRSKQTIRVKSVKSSSQQSQLQLRQTPEEHQQPEKVSIDQDNQKQQNSQKISQKQSTQTVKQQEEVSEKEPFYYRNPNIIFQAIDEDVQAEQYQTKVSHKSFFEDLCIANKGPQEIEEIDFYKYPATRTDRPLLSPKIQSSKISSKKQHQIQQKPIINHLKDTQVSLVSSQISQSSHQTSIKLPDQQAHSQQKKRNEPQSKKKSRQQKQTKQHQNLKKPSQKEQIYTNIFQPKDDLQFDEPEHEFSPQPQKWNPGRVKKQIIHADLESIYTVSDRADSDDFQDNYRTNVPIINRPYQTVTSSSAAYMNAITSVNARNSPLIEDIQDFDEDNQRPSSIFQQPVKNLLSNLYDQLPVGIKPGKKQKKITNLPRKNNKKK